MASYEADRELYKRVVLRKNTIRASRIVT